MQSPKQNKPKRRRISSADKPNTKAAIMDADKVVFGKVVYEKVDTVKKKRK